MATRRMIVFEGPAGSGKSYLLQQVRKDLGDRLYGGPELPEIERPRAYVDDIGQWHAQLKDYRSTLHVLASDGRPTLIDRWVVSQHVYDTIRMSEPYLDQQGLALSLSSSFRHMFSAWENHWARKNNSCFELKIEALFVFVVPSSRLIQHLRKNAEDAGRIYPYHPEAEVGLYKQAAFTVMNVPQHMSNVAVDIMPVYSDNLVARRATTLDNIKGWLDHEYVSALSELPEISKLFGLPAPTQAAA